MKFAGKSIASISSNIRTTELLEKIAATELGLDLATANEGDIILAQAITSDGAIRDIEQPDGNLKTLTAGDYLLAVACTRESGRSVNGVVPTEGLTVPGEAEILSNAGGIGYATSFPDPARPPMRVRMVGVVAHQGHAINISQQGIELDRFPVATATNILVGGTSAECGKTTAARILIKGLSAFQNTGAVKISGTGRLRDIRDLQRAGAAVALDFVDAGIPSTYAKGAPVVRSALRVLNSVGASSQTVVIEAGGDLIWAGVPEILDELSRQQRLQTAVLSANDAMGALYGVKFLQDLGIEVACVVGPACNTGAGRQRLQYEGLTCFNLLDVGTHSDYVDFVWSAASRKRA